MYMYVYRFIHKNNNKAKNYKNNKNNVCVIDVSLILKNKRHFKKSYLAILTNLSNYQNY